MLVQSGGVLQVWSVGWRAGVTSAAGPGGCIEVGSVVVSWSRE